MNQPQLNVTPFTVDHGTAAVTTNSDDHVKSVSHYNIISHQYFSITSTEVKPTLKNSLTPQLSTTCHVTPISK